MAREQLALSLQRLTGSQGRLRLLDAHLERIRDEQRRLGSEFAEITAMELRARQAYAERIEAQQRQGAGEVARFEADVASRRGELGAAAREKETLERLKERHHHAYNREVERQERAMLDELAIDGFRRSVA